MTNQHTTTELAHADHGIDVIPASPGTPSEDATAVLMQHAQTMQAAHQLAVALCSSELVPAIYRGKPDNGAAAILYGAELGLNPIQSLQQIFVVHGTPAIYARTMVALVKRAGYIVETVAESDQAVTVRATDPRTGVVEESEWTIERATKAGYTKNQKYETDPRAMLWAKAATTVCRRIAPDVLLGIAHTREELELDQPQVAPRRVANTAGRGVSGLKAALAAPVVDATEEPQAQPAEPEAKAPASAPQKATAEAPITAAQLKKLHVVLQKEGLTERDTALEWLSTQVGRDLTSSKDLTKAEASELIDFLEKAQAADSVEGVGQ